jgi:hypothetical protein
MSSFRMAVVLPVMKVASAVAPGAQDEKRGKPRLPQNLR